MWNVGTSKKTISFQPGEEGLFSGRRMKSQMKTPLLRESLFHCCVAPPSEAPQRRRTQTSASSCALLLWKLSKKQPLMKTMPLWGRSKEAGPNKLFFLRNSKLEWPPAADASLFRSERCLVFIGSWTEATLKDWMDFLTLTLWIFIIVVSYQRALILELVQLNPSWNWVHSKMHPAFLLNIFWLK